jgi:hypothetical protein
MAYTKEGAEKIAEDINDRSSKYQLAHATVACAEYLRDYDPDKHKKQRKIDSINKQRRSALMSKKTERFDQLTERIDTIHSKRRIFIEYKGTIGKSYTVFIDGQLVVTLSKHLADQSFDKDGNYTEGVKLLRHTMAHELGHAILHTDKIIAAGYSRGSSNISDPDDENEANWFADKLVDLRIQRNLHLDKGTGRLFREK